MFSITVLGVKMTTPKEQSKSKRFAKRPRPPLRKNVEKQREESLKELRKGLYYFKLLDSLWFEGDLPENPLVPFNLFANLNWPDYTQLPKVPGNLKNLSESQLRF